MRRALPPVTVALLLSLVGGVGGCASRSASDRRGEGAADRTSSEDGGVLRDPTPAAGCPNALPRGGSPVQAAELPADLREPRRIAPRADFPIFVGGGPLRVAYVDRQTGDLRVVPVTGGEPTTVLRGPDQEVEGAGGPVPGSGMGTSPERPVRLRRGEHPGELHFERGAEEFRVSAEAGAVPARVERAPPEGAFGPVLKAHQLHGGEVVIPVSPSIAVVLVGEGLPVAKGLYVADAGARTLRRALPGGLEVVWAPQRRGEGEVVFGASDGRYWVLDAGSLELRCLSAPVPAGLQPGPFALSDDGQLMAWAARRMGATGLPTEVVGLLNLRTGADQVRGEFANVSSLAMLPVPGRRGFILSPRSGVAPYGAVLLSLDEERGLTRITSEQLGMGWPDVSAAGVVFSREKPVTETVDTARPATSARDPRLGCDPVPPMGGCGWVSNGCDYVWNGPCVRVISEPDPTDGVYFVPIAH